jgi:hypothetical protein
VATLPLSTVTTEFAAAAAAQSSAPLAMSDPRSSGDWWRADSADPSSTETPAAVPTQANPNGNDLPTNRASQAP